MTRALRFLFSVLCVAAVSFGCAAQQKTTSNRHYKIFGPQGGIATTLTLPEGFDPQRDSCHMVILMHGIFSSKDYPPMPGIAKELARHGIGSLAIDFGGHGKSQGKKVNMTIARELQEARAAWDYVSTLPYVRGISLLGHSQGGVVASMLAGLLCAGDAASVVPVAGAGALRLSPPTSVILLAPGAVIKEATQGGRFFGKTFDPKDPPAYIKCFGMYKLGREYMLSTQELDIYGTSAQYEGPVCIIHGTEDGIVPLWCSERYDSTYKHSTLHSAEDSSTPQCCSETYDSTYARSTLHLIEGENHLMYSHLSETKRLIIEFLISLDTVR